jgi:hypothetical protein
MSHVHICTGIDRRRISTASVGGCPERSLREGRLDASAIPGTGEASAGLAAVVGNRQVEQAVDHDRRDTLAVSGFVAEQATRNRGDRRDPTR